LRIIFGFAAGCGYDGKRRCVSHIPTATAAAVIQIIVIIFRAWAAVISE